jgi:hypothetical protein
VYGAYLGSDLLWSSSLDTTSAGLMVDTGTRLARAVYEAVAETCSLPSGHRFDGGDRRETQSVYQQERKIQS